MRRLFFQKFFQRQAAAAIDQFSQFRPAVLGELEILRDTVEKIDVRERYAEIIEAEFFQHLGGDEQDFDIGHDDRLAYLFDTQLMKFVGGALGRFVVTEDLAGIAKAQGAILAFEARGDCARDEGG